MRYKAIFIDIDDTILDYIPCCREAFDAAMAALEEVPTGSNGEYQVTNEELFELFFSISGRLFSEAKHGKYTIAEVMELYPAEFVEKMNARLGKSGCGSAIKEQTEIFKHAFRGAWGKTHTLVTGAQEILEYLSRKGYRLFAASNSFGHLQRSRLEHAGVLHFFEDTYISMDIGYDKPDLRFYQEALCRSGLRADEVLMIGDSMTTDILGAQAAGIDAIFFDRRGEIEDGKGQIGACKVIRSLDQLSAIL